MGLYRFAMEISPSTIRHAMNLFSAEQRMFMRCIANFYGDGGVSHG